MREVRCVGIGIETKADGVEKQRMIIRRTKKKFVRQKNKMVNLAFQGKRSKATVCRLNEDCYVVIMFDERN